jgi:hypothetical protein
MKKNEDTNPFLISGYAGPNLFCDREKETVQLVKNAVNGINSTLLSIRRMGKTGLLHHTIGRIRNQKKGIGIYADIFDTENLRDFTNRLASAMLQVFPEKHPFWKKAMELLKQLHPIISYDEMNGQPQVTLDYSQPKQYEYSLQSILSFLEKQNKLIVVAIDEFQQITQYPEKNMEAILRTQIQQLKNVRFIFSGSSPHMLSEMFHHAKRPFFSSTQSIDLNEINEQEYSAFIETKFRECGRTISTQSIEYILDFTRRHTYYTQALCNRVFADGGEDIQLEQARLAANTLLKENETIFFQYRNMLTSNQWSMLKAIAKEGNMYQPNAKHIVNKYRMGPSSVIQRSIEALLSKEMIYSKETKEGKYYCVYDCFLARWLEHLSNI